MKKLLIFLILVCPLKLAAQGVLVTPQTALKTVNGLEAPMANATITVCAAGAIGAPCSPPLTNAVFSDAALTQPKTNPFTADASGNYSFAIAPGTYTVTVTGPNVPGYSYQIMAQCSLGGNCTLANVTIGTLNVTSQLNVSKNIPATPIQNQSSPIVTLGATYWNGSASADASVVIQRIVDPGTNPNTRTDFTNNFGGDFQFNNAVDVSGSVTAAGALNAGSDVLLYGNTPANSGANFVFGALKEAGNYWTGSASAQDLWKTVLALGTGSNPTSTLTLSHTGSSGVAQVVFPNLIFNAATPTGTAGQVGFGTTAGFGSGTPATAMTTTTKGAGSGPTTPQTVVNYLEIDIGGTKYWIPLVQ